MDLVDPPHGIPIACADTDLLVILDSFPVSLLLIELEELFPEFVGLLVLVKSLVLLHLLMFLVDLREVFIKLFILLFPLLIEIDLILID